MTAGNPGGGLGDILGGLVWRQAKSAYRVASIPGGAKPGGSLSDLIPGGLGGHSWWCGGRKRAERRSRQPHQGVAGRGTRQSRPILGRDWTKSRILRPITWLMRLGTDTLDALSQHTGLGREDLLAGLSQHLPDLIDQLTPNGRMPSEEEANTMV